MKENCKHFTGIQYNQCSVGIIYRVLAFYNAAPEGWARRLPCLWRNREEGGAIVPCRHYELPTEEELRERDKQFKQLLQVIDLITAAAKENGNKTEWTAEKICPTCGKKLVIISFEYGGKGKIRAQCETDDCINVME